MKQTELFKRIQNGHCVLLGFGISNKPLVAWLQGHGAARVTVRDKRTEQAMRASGDYELCQSLGAEVICGEDYLKDIQGDVLFRTPGLRPDAPGIRNAVEQGAVLTSEMELFLNLTEATVIGITGSDGKTTTTTLTALFLEKEAAKRGTFKVFRGGNIGNPLLPEVEQMTVGDVAVVELSSFQLMTATESPHRAVLTNISPNHLDWHPDMDEYIAAKRNVFDHMPCERLVVNAENDVVRDMAMTATVPVTRFSSVRTGFDSVWNDMNGSDAIFVRDGIICLSDGKAERQILPLSEIRLPGWHNVENYMAAIAVTDGLVSNESIREVAAEFTGVPHRQELVAEHGGVRYINSSIDSCPSRTATALRAMDAEGVRPIIICGGRDKRVPFDTLADDLCRYAKAVVLTGEARGQIMDALQACPAFDPDRLPVTVVPAFTEAVNTACDLATAGDVVLLSPACTSFDAFNHFDERGDAFKRIVLEWIRNNF